MVLRGGPNLFVVLSRIRGVRPAEPGEFTKEAYIMERLA